MSPAILRLKSASRDAGAVAGHAEARVLLEQALGIEVGSVGTEPESPTDRGMASGAIALGVTGGAALQALPGRLAVSE